MATATNITYILSDAIKLVAELRNADQLGRGCGELVRVSSATRLLLILVNGSLAVLEVLLRNWPNHGLIPRAGRCNYTSSMLKSHRRVSGVVILLLLLGRLARSSRGSCCLGLLLVGLLQPHATPQGATCSVDLNRYSQNRAPSIYYTLAFSRSFCFCSFLRALNTRNIHEHRDDHASHSTGYQHSTPYFLDCSVAGADIFGQASVVRSKGGCYRAVTQVSDAIA